jgi:hypothetical protein
MPKARTTTPTRKPPVQLRSNMFNLGVYKHWIQSPVSKRYKETNPTKTPKVFKYQNLQFYKFKT